jgi:hypothetical protein
MHYAIVACFACCALAGVNSLMVWEPLAMIVGAVSLVTGLVGISVILADKVAEHDRAN